MHLRSWLKLPIALAFVCLAFSTARAQTTDASSASPLAFLSVNVLPMTPGEPILRDQTVLVEDGRITAIGRTGSVRIPRRATRVGGQGKYLMPGLADMHVHLEHFDRPEYLKLFLIHGVTMVRSMDGRPGILDWKRQAASGTLPSPDIHTAGPVLDGSPPRRDDNLALATPEEARRAVNEQADVGYDFLKVYDNLAPDVFRAIMDEAAARNMPVVGHVPDAVGLDTFLTSGIRSIEHVGDFADSLAAIPPDEVAPDSLTRRLGFPVDLVRIEALAAKVAASRVWAIPTMITDDRLVAPPADVERWVSDPEIATVDRGILTYYWRSSLARSAGRLGADDWRWVDRGRQNRLAVIGAFHRAGVPLMTGTDTPNPFVFPGSSMHDELANYVAAGLTPAEALTLATREPARFLGQSQAWGTIETGKLANLLLLDANPMEDITATRKIAGVVIGGRWLSPERIGQMRLEVERVAAASE